MPLVNSNSNRRVSRIKFGAMEDHMESEELSNDTTMISELLKSAEVMQPTHLVAASSCKSSQKTDRREQIQTHQQIINVIEKQIVMPPPPSPAMDQNANNILLINQGFSDVGDTTKLHHMRHVHIPYILNGELYQIQTQDGENVTVKCCHCPPDRVYRGSVRSTGNFHMHIKRRHPDLLEKLHNMKVNALLERRDRLMRNRKVSSRNNHRNRQGGIGISSFIAPGATSSTLDVFKDEPKLSLANSLDGPLPLTSSSSSEFRLLHTHKLKIKEVFERHQMQQREAAEMRNCKNSYDGGSEEPINYSLKSQEKAEIGLQEQQQPNNILSSNYTTQTAGDYSNPLVQQSLNVNENISKESLYENQQYSIRDISTTSSQSSTSSSILSTYSSRHNNAPYSSNMETMPHQLNCLQEQNGLSIIKPEHLLISTEEQHALDLTMHTDSGIFSNCNESINNTSHNSVTATNTNGQRAGSQHMFTPQTSGPSGGKDSASKWQDLLQHVETSLRDIQHEMNIRNQIESNRMFLEIAKFKFLHPGFQFNW